MGIKYETNPGQLNAVTNYIPQSLLFCVVFVIQLVRKDVYSGMAITTVLFIHQVNDDDSDCVILIRYLFYYLGVE